MLYFTITGIFIFLASYYFLTFNTAHGKKESLKGAEGLLNKCDMIYRRFKLTRHVNLTYTRREKIMEHVLSTRIRPRSTHTQKKKKKRRKFKTLIS